MLSISEARSRWWFVIKIQSGVARGAIQRAQRLRRINADYALCASHFTQNATLSFLLFIVAVCFDAQTARRQCARRCGWMGAFKCRKAVICFIHSLLPLKVALCRHLTELGAFRFGSGQFSQWTFNVLAPPAAPCRVCSGAALASMANGLFHSKPFCFSDNWGDFSCKNVLAFT